MTKKKQYRRYSPSHRVENPNGSFFLNSKCKKLTNTVIVALLVFTRTFPPK